MRAVLLALAACHHPTLVQCAYVDVPDRSYQELVCRPTLAECSALPSRASPCTQALDDRLPAVTRPK